MPEQQQTKEMARLEAILFACGDPVSVSRLADASGLPEASIPNWMQQLEEFYQQAGSSLTVQKLGESWQLCTREQYANYIRLALVTKKAAPLSNAAMEALTIVAYNQPVTKSFVEHVRGIDSSSMINSLVEKGLLVYVAGGLLKPGTQALVGAAARESIGRYNFTKAFIGTNGISLGHGYTTPDIEEASIKSLAIDHSYVSYVLADSPVDTIYLSELSPAALKRRTEMKLE